MWRSVQTLVFVVMTWRGRNLALSVFICRWHGLHTEGLGNELQHFDQLECQLFGAWRE